MSMTTSRAEERPQAATILVRYIAFAAVATALNLGAQAASLALYGGPLALAAAMAIGTGVGLVAKYLLDRRWIFCDRARSLAEHGSTFSLYTAMGLVTTALFWGAELLANALDPDLTFAGAAAGLALGYYVKYRLDRRFVFKLEPA